MVEEGGRRVDRKRYSGVSKLCFPVQTLQKELQGHQPRIDDIMERSRSLLQEESSEGGVPQRLKELQELWRLLLEEVGRRDDRLGHAHQAQQYYFDAAEAEAWMSEQELYMMSEEKAKVSPTYTTLQLHRLLHHYLHAHSTTLQPHPRSSSPTNTPPPLSYTTTSTTASSPQHTLNQPLATPPLAHNLHHTLATPPLPPSPPHTPQPLATPLLLPYHHTHSSLIT